MSQAAFAKKVGLSAMAISLILKGDKEVYLSTAMKIVKKTNGKITYKDLAKRDCPKTKKITEFKLSSIDKLPSQDFSPDMLTKKIKA